MYEHSILKFSDAHPCSQRAECIRSCLSKKLSESLAHLIDISEEVIDPVGVFRENCPTSFHSPLLFCINAEWLDAVQEGNVHKIQQCSSLLNQLVLKSKFPTFLNFDAFQFSKPLTKMIVKNMTATFPERENVWIEKAPSKLYNRSINLIKQSLSILKQVDLNIYGEILQLIKNYVILDSNRIIYGSSFNLFGMIFLKAFENEQTLFEMIEMVVHESAHHYIFAVSVFDELVLNPPTEVFKAPFRKDPRPMMGLYHATFVLGRLLYVFSKLLSEASNLEIEPQEIESKIIDYDQRFRLSIELIHNHALLTDLGRELIISTQEMTYTAVLPVLKTAA